MAPMSLLTGPFCSGDIVVKQWGPDSRWPGEWEIEAAFSGANRYEASIIAIRLREMTDRRVMILRTVDFDGTLEIVREVTV